jgi:hypothetical protein
MNCNAQTALPIDAVVDASLTSGMVQRVLQYELMLGSELESRLAVCVDEGLGSTWMIPEKLETEVPAKAIERVRRRLEICQAVSGTRSQDMTMRLAAGIRLSMESQLMAAHALELSKSLAQSCLTKSQSQEVFRICMTKALQMNPGNIQFSKWMTLYDRRANFAALGPNGN